MMWLIDSTTIRLRFMPNSGNSHYAVLSHTWNGDDEISFQEFNSSERDISHPRFRKIIETCRLARERGIPYVWVDSCCIDKSSSAELTEAINSMFRWYKDSTVCFTYLADLAANALIDVDLQHCKWFTRAWTLKEVIAPTSVEFYNEDWHLIGDKKCLLKALTSITMIQEGVLRNSDSLSKLSVAMRMSWAAKRQATREEDLAYCLLGVFGVHLPLIYGEGSNAFVRLQEAIAQNTYDLSLFAWTDQDHREKKQKYRGILARSPAEFQNCDGMWKPAPWVYSKHDYMFTNQGLRLTADLYERDSSCEEDDYLLHLECWRDGRTVFIRLIRTPSGYVRHCSDTLTALLWRDSLKLHHFKRREIYVSTTVTPLSSEMLSKSLLDGFYVEICNKTRYQCALVRHYPPKLWSTRRGCFMVGISEEMTGLLEMSISDCSKAVATDTLDWPNIYIVVDTNGGRLWPPRPWAALLPTNKGQLSQWHGSLECSHDIVSATYSCFKDNPWTSHHITDMLVAPDTPEVKSAEGESGASKHLVKVTVKTSPITDEDKTLNSCRLEVHIEPV